MRFRLKGGLRGSGGEGSAFGSEPSDPALLGFSGESASLSLPLFQLVFSLSNK